MKWLSLLACVVAGALTTLAIPPFTHWWLAVITLGIFGYFLNRETTKTALFICALAFGLGHFGTGVSWVFVSIHEFGNTTALLAGILTGIFVALIAAVFALPFCGLHYLPQSHWRLILGVPLFWAFSEWLRSWLLTGFPWLYVGYSQLDGPLIGWAPIGGVLFVSLLIAFTSSVLTALPIRTVPTPIKLLTLIAAVIIWSEGKALKDVEWTQASGESISVGIVQPNIPQEKKWDPDFRQPTIDILTRTSAELWQNDWVVWPEAAIPDVYFRSQELLTEMDQRAQETDTSLITGILYDDHQQNKYFNSLVGLGDASGLYFKQRLVPFGEYVPLEDWLRGLIAFFNLPTSIISAGTNKQALLQAGNISIASIICYEIVYPALVAKLAKNADVILTVSNDAWFGESIGPLQHFHMARMRAIETGRYVVRSTNNGVSAVIAADGAIVQQSKQFIQTGFTSTVQPMTGNTPYLIWRDGLVLAILFLLATFLFFAPRELDNAIAVS